VLLAGSGVAPAQFSDDDTSTLRRIGDVLHIALPAAAGGSAAIKRDWEGLLQFGTSFGATVGTFSALKQAIPKDRPDVTDERSFPSGHTAMSFSGASFILTRYGKKWGIPAMATAGFVGYTRIKGQKHYEDDVIAGAGIGLLYNLLLVRPMGESVFLKPQTFAGGGAGIMMGFDPGVPGARNSSAPPPPDTAFKYRIEFEFAAVDVQKALVQSPRELGTLVPLERGEGGATPSARFRFDWEFRPRHEFNFYWDPFEGRDFEGVPEVDIDFAGVTFPAGEEGIARYRFNDVGFRYRYGLIENRWVTFRPGATLSLQETKATLVQEQLELFGEVAKHTVMPLIHAQFQFHFTKEFHFVAEGDGMQLPQSRYFGGSLALRWKPKPRWDLNFGYRGVSRWLDIDDLYNRYSADSILLGAGYSF